TTLRATGYRSRAVQLDRVGAFRPPPALRRPVVPPSYLPPLRFARLRDAFQSTPRCFLSRPPEIGERDHANEPLVPVEHRKTPHLVLGHDLRRIPDVIVLEAIADTLGHHLADCGVAGRALFGDRADDNVPVSHHSN